MYSEETPDDGQRNCPKHVEFYSKNKFEKLVHLVGFIIRIYHDARSPERQKKKKKRKKKLSKLRDFILTTVKTQTLYRRPLIIQIIRNILTILPTIFSSHPRILTPQYIELLAVSCSSFKRVFMSHSIELSGKVNTEIPRSDKELS